MKTQITGDLFHRYRNSNITANRCHTNITLTAIVLSSIALSHPTGIALGL